MKKILAALFGLVFLAAIVSAQEVKPYSHGMVTSISFIKIKPGMFDDYMKYLDGPYKALMEANKKAGLIVRYNVFWTEARNLHEADLLLTTTYTNMAALDKIDEEEAVAAKVIGSSDIQNKTYIDRQSMREVLGSQLIRELLLK
jgi:L-rhamnose mutarotase